MTVARKVEFDGARANHQAILRLKSAHRLDADKMPDLQRNRFVGRIGKAELGSDRAAALAGVGDLNALSLKHARQRLGLGPRGGIPVGRDANALNASEAPGLAWAAGGGAGGDLASSANGASRSCWSRLTSAVSASFSLSSWATRRSASAPACEGG